MARIKSKTKFPKKSALLCLGLACLLLIAGFGMNVARAAWEEPSAEAPGGNVYSPLNIGLDMQTKQGHLLLDPLYNPQDSMPSITEELEIRGQGGYFSTLYASQTLTVDTDTLTANSTGVGIGTANPTVALQVIDGRVSATTDTAGVSAIQSQSSSNSGLYAYAEDAGYAAVYGTSAVGYGVYGVNEFVGVGVYGRSEDSSAVAGSTGASYDSANIIAGIYGQATGLNSWAGYFQQRLYGTDQIVGRKFVPNRLQNSQIPYTANWRVRQIDDSALREPHIVAFDGSQVWVAGTGWDTNFVSVYEASTGAVVTEIQDGQITRDINSMIYAEGYIWAATNCSTGRPCLVRFNTTTYAYNTYDLDSNSGTAVDLVYDGAGHIWTANQVTVSGNTRTSISRLTINDGSLLAPATTVTATCSSVVLRQPGGITFDGTDLWVSFPDSPEAIAKVVTAAPYTATPYCNDVIGHRPSDIAYDSTNSRLWVAYNPGSYDNRAGLGKYLLDGSLETEYLYAASPSPFAHFVPGLTQVEFDNQSAGGPFIWTNNSSAGGLSYLFKFNISSATVEHEYELSASMEDFTFDRVTAGGPYVWGAHILTGEISRSEIDADYSTTYYVSHAGMGAKDLMFDGSYVWLANGRGSTVGKYRAADGKKIGNYYAGQQPRHLIYDGRYLWSVTHYNQHDKNLVQLDAATGAVVGEYKRSTNNSGMDAVFDGRHLWIVGGGDNWLERVRLSNCNSGTGLCDGTGTAMYSNLQAADGSGNINPSRLIFDGADLWVTHGRDGQANKISRITFNDSGINVANTLPINDISGSFIRGDPNISAIEYDGTYIWLGTIQADGEGNSVYKINPSDGSVAGKFPIYHEPGRCSATDSPPELANDYCAKDSDCNGGTCLAQVVAENRWGREAGVDAMVFDGINMWVFSGTAIDSGIRRECDDGIDNDGDGKIDRVAGNQDLQCENYYDLHEADTGTECSDGLDNDGNGLCDFNGAAGYPGCSGKPDLGCSSASDISEATTNNDSFLTRIVAATNQIVDSVNVNEHYFSASEMVFDGSHIWYGGTKYHALGQYYSGNGLGVTDLAGSVGLLASNLAMPQPGSFAITGSATFSGSLTVVGDLVVQNNTWGGSSDNLGYFGQSCPQGQFAKGVNTTTEVMQCRPL